VPKPFNVQVNRQPAGGVSVLELDGFVDAHTAPEFEQAIQAEIDAGQTRLVVDGARLTYISSAGLGVFMGFIEEVRDRGGDIKICRLVPKVRQVFELLGFHKVYEILDDRNDALRRFAEADGREV
jgi:anti-sigma B factor antagonist